MVDRGEADVLVAATVAGDVVGVEEFVVVDLRDSEKLRIQRADFCVRIVVGIGNHIGGALKQECLRSHEALDEVGVRLRRDTYCTVTIGNLTRVWIGGVGDIVEESNAGWDDGRLT